jgi:hypothetical protein
VAERVEGPKIGEREHGVGKGPRRYHLRQGKDQKSWDIQPLGKVNAAESLGMVDDRGCPCAAAHWAFCRHRIIGRTSRTSRRKVQVSVWRRDKAALPARVSIRSRKSSGRAKMECPEL